MPHIQDIHLVAATLASGMLAARPDQGAAAAADYYFQILEALQNKSGVPGSLPSLPQVRPAEPARPVQDWSSGSGGRPVTPTGARQIWP